MKSLKWCVLVLCALSSAAAGGESSADIVVRVDNKKVLLNGVEMVSLDVLRTVVANIQRETVVSIEANQCTKWKKVEEIMEIVRERADLLTMRFSTFLDSDDAVCKPATSSAQ